MYNLTEVTAASTWAANGQSRVWRAGTQAGKPREGLAGRTGTEVPEELPGALRGRLGPN